MIKRLDNVKLNIFEKESKLVDIAKSKCRGGVKYFRILKKSLDARDKNNIFWTYSIAFSDEKQPEKPELDRVSKPRKIAVIGAGPAGLFCALRLIERGFRPIIIERGENVDDRKSTCGRFFCQRELDINSNVQFGEGGAGTFSDGKLNTQTHDVFNKDVLELFYKFGAPEEVLYLNKPHIGSDKLSPILKNMRAFIEANGGKYLFNTQFIGLKQKDGAVSSITLKNVKTCEETEIYMDDAVLALGHSARDTFKMLKDNGVEMQRREFAVGVRIEHLSDSISFAQYGNNFKFLPTADYKFVSHAGERTIFTFCMCPGGVVVSSSSEEGGVVTNGMSEYARDGVNSNSALMVQLKFSDFCSDDLFAGMRYQQNLERLAYEAGGNSYRAPVQLYKDFKSDKVSYKFGDVEPSYLAGVSFANLNEVLPAVAVESLKKAIPDFGKKLKGFDCPDAVLTGIESRFTSPVRILRDENCESISVKGLYPCGEGSGYSGGITSSAADGLKIAEKIYEKYKNH